MDSDQIINVEEDKQLTQLEEIGKELDSIEKKLEALPDEKQPDLTKYNRKQRRQLQRRMVREEKEKEKKLEQKGNTFITRREFVGLFQSTQKLRDRLYYIDVLTSAMEKILLEKNIITENELSDYIKKESEKALAFQEIQKELKNYEVRLKKCVDLKIDPNISIIPQQIYEDADLSLDEKRRLAQEYNLQTLLKIFDAQATNQQNNNLVKEV